MGSGQSKLNRVNIRVADPTLGCNLKRLFFSAQRNHNHQTKMIRYKFIAVIAVTYTCVGASLLNAATIPAGVALPVKTVSSVS